MKIITALALALSLGGCATCQTHPVACGIASAIVVGSVIATVDAHNGGSNAERARRGIGSPPCATNPALCR